MWNTKKQTCIALSSTESEFRSLVEATKEARWIQILFQELGFDRQKSIQLMCDNQSAIKISKNPQFHSKTKHFEIHLNFVWDMVERGFVNIFNAHTDCQLADMLTKALGRLKFTSCKQLLNFNPANIVDL